MIVRCDEKSMVWYGMVWYGGMVWYHTIPYWWWYGMVVVVWYHHVWYLPHQVPYLGLFLPRAPPIDPELEVYNRIGRKRLYIYFSSAGTRKSTHQIYPCRMISTKKRRSTNQERYK